MTLRRTVRITNSRANRITSAPAAEPVNADDLRTHLGIDATAMEDAVANNLIAEAREMIEEHLNLAMITQTWRLTLDNWPAAFDEWWDGVRDGHVGHFLTSGKSIDVEVPRWPLQSITSVTVYDEDGTSSAVTVANVFDVDTQSFPGRITLKRGATWPVALRANNAIEVVYVAGYGAAGVAVPAPMRRAVKQLAAGLYANRGDCSVESVLKASSAGGLIDTYKIKRV